MDAQSEKTYLTQIARLFPRQGEWTEETFFMLPESNQIVELVNGEVIIMPPPRMTTIKAQLANCSSR